MPRIKEEVLEERRQLKAQYGELFNAVSALLYREDPIGINFEVNPDEYDPEAGTILPRLCGCQAEEDVLCVVHEEFVRWFESNNAGPKEHYKEIAAEIWQLWQRHRPAGRSKQQAIGNSELAALGGTMPKLKPIPRRKPKAN